MLIIFEKRVKTKSKCAKTGDSTLRSQNISDEKRSRFELTTVLETSRMLIESKSSDFILDNLLLISMGKLMVTKAAILLNKPEINRYEAVKVKGKLPFSEQKVLELNIGNINLDEAYFSSDSIDGLDLDQATLFNLRTSNRHIGFLVLGQKATKEPLSENELQFIEGLSIISSVAIANSQMFNELKQTNRNLDQRIHELNTLFDLSKEFNLLVDREKISRIFKFALLGQLFIRTFFLIYKSDKEHELLAESNLTKKFTKSEIKSVFEAAEDVTMTNQELQKQIPFLEKNEICALVEIKIQQNKVAVIGVGNRANNKPLTASDFNFLKSLANLAATSIQKTYLLEERIEKERLEEELSIAKAIQQGLLPDPIPEIKGIDLAGSTVSSSQVGGDYFDIVETPDGNHIVAIADVTGKGFPAALLMANLQSMLHVLLPVDITLAEATERINNLIYQNTPSDKFITFFWAKYMADQRILSYVNAGHNPPLLLSKGETEFKKLSDGGLLLGAMESMMPYEQTEIELKKNDIFIAYTDGVNEAQNPGGTEEFGEDRLMQCILDNREKSAEGIRSAIIEEVDRFTEYEQFDDLTLIIMKVL